MSVRRSLRGQGIGKLVLAELERRASSLGYDNTVLETTTSWHDAVGFYKSHGYAETGRADGDTHFIKKLST